MKVAILGGGLMGRLIALAFNDLKAELTLFEKKTLDHKGNTASIAAAMLAPESESVHMPTELLPMADRAIERWPDILKQLGIPHALHRQGSLIICHPQDKHELTDFIQRIPRQNKSRLLNEQTLYEMEPGLAKGLEGCLVTGEGHLDNDVFLERTTQWLYEHVHVFEKAEVVQTFQNRVHWLEVSGQAKQSAFDWIIDCRGIGAKVEYQSLRGVRGEIIRIRAPHVNLIRPVRLLHPRYPLYIVPKPDHRFVIGATEIETESQAPITVRSVLELLSAAYSVSDGFAEAQVEAMQVGLRPAFSDHRPKVSVHEQVIRVNGLYRHGFLLGPAIAESVFKVIQNPIESIEGGYVEHLA